MPAESLSVNHDIPSPITIEQPAAPVSVPQPVPEQPQQKSIYGKVPEIPVLEAVDGIRFDFNDGIRILFPQNGKEYRVIFSDLDTGICV